MSVREREKERGKERERGREREKERERGKKRYRKECVYVCQRERDKERTWRAHASEIEIDGVYLCICRKMRH